MEIILAIVVFFACLISFICGLYVRGLFIQGKEITFKQIKRDLGIKPKAEIFSPSKRQKVDEILKGLEEEI